MKRTTTLILDIPSPMTLADGCEYDLTLELEVPLDVSDGIPEVADYEQIMTLDGTLTLAGIDICVAAQADRLLRSFLAVPANRTRLDDLIARGYEPEEECPDPIYERARVNGRLILPNGRDVS